MHLDAVRRLLKAHGIDFATYKERAGLRKSHQSASITLTHTASVEMHHSFTKGYSCNVLGMLEGTTQKDEFIIM